MGKILSGIGKAFLIIFVSLLLLGSVGLIYEGATRIQEAHQLSGSEVKEPGELAETGRRAVIRGIARPAEEGTLNTKYQNKEAIAQEWKTEEYDPDVSRTGEPSWETKESGSEVVDFYIEGASDRILVNTTNSTRFDLTENTVRKPDEDIRYMEESIQPGEEVLVEGFVRENDEGGMYIGAGGDVTSVEIYTESKEETSSNRFIAGVLRVIMGTILLLFLMLRIGQRIR